MLDVDADRPHPVPAHPVPPQVSMPWKENWCFAGVDAERRTALLWHVSLRPTDGEGIFTCKVDGPDVRVRHVGRHSLTTAWTQLPLTDGRMRVEVIESHRRFQLCFDGGDGITVAAEFVARFPPFDFADGAIAPGTSTIGELGLHVFPFHHYEQAMAFTAVVELPGTEPLHLAGWGNRDHSWGWRDDFGFRSHHWINANFADAFVQGSTMIDTTYPGRKYGGFVATADGNDPVVAIDVSDSYWESPADEPLPAFERDVTYALRTRDGSTIELTAHLTDRYRILYLNARHPDRSQLYQDAQIFCPYTRHDTGERGAGLLELGKHLAGPGIADRIGRERG
jgi:hypothetical protein